MQMNKTILAAAGAMLSLAAAAGVNTDRLHLGRVAVNRGDSLLTFNMTVDPKAYQIGSNDILTLTPMLVAGTDTVEMAPVSVAGKGAWFARIREGLATPQTLLRAGKDLPVEYSSTVGFGPRFETSTIIVRADTSTVCNCEPPQSGDLPVAELDFRRYTPELPFEYIAPRDTADKVFDLSGRANIIFKVNRTDIDWSYFSNQAELDSIMKSVNAVRDNEYATVRRILLTGYASPEGPYANNVRLAKGRTEVVKKYVEAHSTFPASVYDTSSVPEDWQGLRAWIAASSMPAKDAMLAFIDDPSVPVEKKNDIFRQRFPQEYPYLLKNVYPELRHTDYRITYSIRKFYDVDEIRSVFDRNPRMLSLNELYLLAGSYAPGTPEYDKVFATAAVLYPESEVANLNAAGSAMSVGNLTAARMYLDKLAPSAGASYARGILAAKEGDYPAALGLLEEARKGGVKAAAEAITQVRKAMDTKEQIIIL